MELNLLALDYFHLDHGKCWLVTNWVDLADACLAMVQKTSILSFAELLKVVQIKPLRNSSATRN
jgi:hypothetical protein